MQELVDSQRSYQDALRAALSEQQANRQLITQLLGRHSGVPEASEGI